MKALILLLVFVLAGCANQRTVEFPMLEGWYEDQRVYYITTEVSDAGMAAEMKANFAPRLRQAIPRYPKPPQVKTILERVYGFPEGEQVNTVFASIPSPLGHKSEDLNYSPIWLMFMVTWKDKSAAVELTSEEAIFAAEEAGLVTVERTDVVVNCPIVSIDGDLRLPL